MADETIIALAADIVVAHLSHNATSASDVPDLIRAVHSALSGLGQVASVAPEPATPAVSIRASVRPDAITCLECGARLKVLKRHLSTDHSLSPQAYRERWSLKADYPLVAPAYSATRKSLALKIGLGRKAVESTAPAPEPEAAPKSVRPRKKAEQPESDAQPATTTAALRKRKASAPSASSVEPTRPVSRKRKSATKAVDETTTTD
jgi:predicted transcriptional regulator